MSLDIRNAKFQETAAHPALYTIQYPMFFENRHADRVENDRFCHRKPLSALMFGLFTDFFGSFGKCKH
jgi:hypothetical protein